MKELTYKKRSGTSGIRGQLYETKLISLIHFRAKHDTDVQEYHLATNVDEIGTFDDICIKAKIKVNDKEKSVAVFIQAKHREGDKVLTLNSKNDLAKYFDSYLNIRRAFKPTNKDVLFKGNFDDINSFFVMYTTAKDDLNTKPFEGEFADKLNELICTGDHGLQPCYKDGEVEFLCDVIMKEQFATLAKQLGKFLCEDQPTDNANNSNAGLSNHMKNEGGNIMSMNDDLVLLYHVILVRKVINVTDILLRNEEEEHRIASFRSEFFDSDEETVVIFKNNLYMEMLKNRKLNENEINTLLLKLFDKPTDVIIFSELIGNVIVYNKNGKLEFVNKSMPDEFKRQLDKINILQATIDEAIELAAKAILVPRRFKVPAAFGNKDLTIRGKVDVNVEQILENLKQKIVNVLNESRSNIVSIDDSLGDEFLQLNAGIASAVGNILIMCNENPNLLKFTESCASLGDLAKRLFLKIQSKIQNMHVYRFHIKVKSFPKLHISYDDDSIETIRDQATALGEHIGRFICEENDAIMAIDNEFVLRYHVVLAQTVIDVSDIERRNEDEEHRVARFRQEFFESNDEFILPFKNSLYTEVLKHRKIDENNIDDLLSNFFKQPSITTLSKIIGTVITYTNSKFEFVHNNVSDDSKRLLDVVIISQSTVDAAISLAAKEILVKQKFNVAASFGNKDLTIRGKKGLKIEKRLEHLKTKIADLMKNSTDKIVVFNEALGDGLLKISGGFAGLVGNMFVSDENTRLMKFTDNWESLGALSKRLYVKLLSKFNNLQEYKFDVKVKKFPKISFERSEHDENLVVDFLTKLLFYTNQADETDVGGYLKDEIDNQCNNVNNFRIGSDTIYLKYHDEVQKWWMLPKEAPYLTKQNKFFENALSAVDKKPLLTVLSMMHTMKIKNYTKLIFNENAINSLQIDVCPPATIFIANSCAYTVAKMLQFLKNNDIVILDLEYIFNLQANDHNKVCVSLNKTNKMKILIIVNINIHNNRNWNKKMETIAKAVMCKETIIITNKFLEKNVMEILKQLFKTNNIVCDEKSSLTDLTEETQDIIMQKTVITFQDVEVSLTSVIDEYSKGFVEGDVLDKIINNEYIAIGKPISNISYETCKSLYIDRRVVRVDHLKPNVRFSNKGVALLSLYDVQNDVVLLTAKPGMGKTTLLTHLSVKTKMANIKVWIVRINLLDHCREFSGWQERKTDVNSLETLNFFCKVMLSNLNGKLNDFETIFEEANDDVYLKDCTAEEDIVFEIKMFLDFFNRKELIFIFDGFDEICPHYTNEVLSLLKTVRNFPKNHKMWITSRSYDKVKSVLELEFGMSYEIQHFSGPEQKIYLENFWKSNIVLKDLNNDQFNNICIFMEFMSAHYHSFNIKNQYRGVKREKHQILFIKVCLNFLNYVRNEIDGCPQFVKDTFNTLFGDCRHTIIFLEDFDTPLHLNLIAEYFLNQIKDDNTKINKWNLNINVFTIYEKVFETKLKKIRFQEKNKIDLYNPDNMIIYEEVRAEFFAKHKKLGAYAVFHLDIHKLCDSQELKEIEDVLSNIKRGKEKTGLIHSVVNGIPIFTHMTFTEFFAIEYVCDLLKADGSCEKQKSIWDFILNIIFFKCSKNVRNILAYKIKTEETLRNVVYSSEEIIFDLLLKQGKGVYTYYENDFSKELYLKVRLSLDEAMAGELCNFIPLLYQIKVKLTEEYLKDPSRCSSKIKRIKILSSLCMKQKNLRQNLERSENRFVTDQSTSSLWSDS